MKQLHTLVPLFQGPRAQFVHATQMHYDGFLARARLTP